jgi:hypothetical protein
MSFFDFIPLVVGSIFLSFGFNSILYFLKFRKEGVLISGRVIAIEKYQSTNRDIDNRRTTTTFFCPIVEFIYEKNTHTIKGSSVNEIRHKLGQAVPVLIRISSDGQYLQAQIKDSINYLMGSVFALMGMGSLSVYTLGENGSFLIALVVSAVIVALGFTMTVQILNFNFDRHKSNIDEPLRSDAMVISEQADYIKEVSAHGFWGGVISVVFFIGSLSLTVIAWNNLPDIAKKLLVEDTESFFEQFSDASWQEEAILFGAGLFFFLASLRSLYYIRKKYGALLRR